MKKIQLTQGKYALVDDADYSWLSDFKWHAIKSYSTFYVRRNESLGGGQYKKIHMHSYILQPDIGLEVDHINGNGLDNRRCNLRLATRYQNMRNVIKKTGNYTSVFKGVYWHSTLSRWAAAISFCGRATLFG
jgi:hypothetical protein